MATRTFRVAGTVVDVQTKKPVPGVRVEAWNNDTAQHMVLNAAAADAQGHFQLVIQADVGVSGTTGTTTVVNTVPVVLKVFQANQLLQTTGDTSIPNLLTFDRAATLQVQTPQAPVTDRFTAPQILNALNFARRSDFAGVFNESRDRTTSFTSVLKDSFLNSVKSVVSQPLQVSSVRNLDVVNQDPKTATQRLTQQNVTVNQVVDYQPSLGTAVTALTTLPKSLQPGDKVNLLVQNGVVKGYEVVAPPAATGPATADLANQVNTLQGNMQVLQTKTDDLEQFKTAQEAAASTTSNQVTALQQKAALVDQLQAQLTQMQQQSAQRDATISALQKQITDVQTAHNALAAELPPARIANLEAAVTKLQTGLH